MLAGVTNKYIKRTENEIIHGQRKNPYNQLLYFK
jgi:hypothetical protein